MARAPLLAQRVKNLPALWDPGSISVLGRSPGEGHGHRVQHSSRENPDDRGAGQAAVHGVAKRQT